MSEHNCESMIAVTDMLPYIEFVKKSKIKLLCGNSHTIAMRLDGSMLGSGVNLYEECEVSGWRDIVSVACGQYNTMGVRSNGTVIAIGSSMLGENRVEDWSGIVEVSCGGMHTVGLRSDGSLVTAGGNGSGQRNILKWTNIAAVRCGELYTVGLRKDGTVVAVGANKSGQCDVSGWTDIAEIACGDRHTVGLRSDGTLVAVGENTHGQCNVSAWTDIVAVACGANHTVGLRSDGTLVAVGENTDGRCNVAEWNGIVAVAAGKTHTVALRLDGTLVWGGDPVLSACNVESWKLFDGAEALERAMQAAAEAEARREAERIAAEEKAKRSGRISKIVSLFIAVLVVVGAVFYLKVVLPANQYKDACAAVEQGQYDTARGLFDKLGDYEDSEHYSAYLRARNGSVDACIRELESVPADFLDAKEKLEFLYVLKELSGIYGTAEDKIVLTKEHTVVTYEIDRAFIRTKVIGGDAFVEFEYRINWQSKRRTPGIGGGGGGFDEATINTYVKFKPGAPSAVEFSMKEYDDEVILGRGSDGLLKLRQEIDHIIQYEVVLVKQ